MKNKIHIIGSIGSGKTTIAKTLSVLLAVPHYELDNVVWKRLDSGDTKRSISDRDEYLNRLAGSDKWIIEGVHHKWIEPSLKSADLIIFLDIDQSKRKWRIIRRFIKQILRIEKANYKPTIKIFRFLHNYNQQFDNQQKPEILKLLSLYHSKVITLNSDDDIAVLLHRLKAETF
ncbi:DNA topology modulation protein FlaR [Corticicoccus populi]|uniref:DNA topology modulation protein FlaR n=1 Tax=Corticicoccus populi TaxID=1812821 RepID=A0ABW5WTI3_9STAP